MIRLVLGTAAVLVTVMMVGTSLFATSHGNPYDLNHNDMIEWVEMEEAVRDYMVDGTITQAEAVDEVLRLLAGIPASVNPHTSHPSPQPTPTSTYPTATPIATRAPTATPTPTPTPIPTLVAPTITYTMGNTGALQISWSYPESLSYLVTGYEVRYSLDGREYPYTLSPTTNGHGVIGNIPIGAEVTLQVRAISKTASSAWATAILTIPAPIPTPTPTTRPTPTPPPTPMSNAYDNGCWEREQLDSDTPSDIRMAAMFRNPHRPEGEDWEAPKPPLFQHGLMLRNVAGRGLVVMVDHLGRWTVSLHKRGLNADTSWVDNRGYKSLSFGQNRYTLASGDLEDEGAFFDHGPEALTHMMFSAVGNDFRLAINGTDVSVDVSQEGLDKIEEWMEPYYYHDSGLWQGHFAFYRFLDGNEDGDLSSLREDIGTYIVWEKNNAPMHKDSPKMVEHHMPLPRVACKP